MEDIEKINRKLPLVLMKCSSCGSKMVKFKYLKYEQMESYLLNENRPLDDIEDYFDWLKTLKPGEFILTLLRRESYSGVTEKYYLRVVEKTSEAGIKLRNLSKIFGYEEGETVYGKDDINAPTAVYKIVAINKHIDSIIRDYCKDKELFDIDKLNKIISKESL